MNEQPNGLTSTLGRIALGLLRGVKRSVGAAWHGSARVVSFTGGLIARVFVLPLYRLSMFIKLRTRRLTLPARGFVLYLFTNRYLFHVLIIGVSVATIGVNIGGRQANAQDAGQQSLLYAIVTGEDARATEQEVHPEVLVHDARYAGPSSLVALPNIDFDYEETDQAPVTALAVPGTIVANLTPHDPNQPSGPTSQRTKTEDYVVEAGDTLSTIAQRFGVNVGTILWANSRTEFQYLRPGDALRIPPVSGVLVKVKKGDTLLALATKYGATAEDIVRVNRLTPDDNLPLDLELVLPGGRPPAVAPTYTSKPSNGVVPTNFQIVPNDPHKPAAADTGSTPATKLLWPTSGHVVTQYYGWRHTGMDIDGDYSSPIYAAHDGTVTTAGWNSGGYGMQILVTGDGVMTRYGHTSKMFVKVGDVVKKGDTIAMVGTTGRSTGTHLHFEVYIKGKRTNPLSYIR